MTDLQDHRKLGKVLGAAEAEQAAKLFFASLRELSVSDMVFGEVAMFKPGWLHGETVIDALAYTGTAKILRDNRAEIRMRFSR